MTCGEFPLIARHFDHVRGSRLDAELGIGGDYALLDISEKQTLAISTDTPVADNHSLPNIDPADLTYEVLAVNLGDLAATGADPAWLTLTLTLPDADKVWLELSSDSLFDLLNYYDMQLIGGDITRGSLSMTLSIYGFAPMGRALTHSRAKPGDWIHVTGTPGDSATGLATLQNRLQVADAEDADYLIKRHPRPLLRILQGQVLHDLANSAIDLSDGLISDPGYIVKASGCSACIDLALLPLSDALSRHVEPKQALCWALSGGEGYESYFTVPELNRGALDVVLGHLDVLLACIGRMTADIEGLCFIHDGEPVTPDWKGYGHFATL